MHDPGELENGQEASVPGHIYFSNDLPLNLPKSGYMVEAVSENFELKREF